MNETGKLATATGAGMLMAKVIGTGGAFWWILGGLTVLVVFNSPELTGAIKKRL
jgi:hypothetical protein